jgi:DGQHR domain-containing protein
MTAKKIQKISVIIPENPFVPDDMQASQHCLAALDVQKLMEWWPGTPHSPHRQASKVRAIQRSLDWKRVAQIAAYLLQQEIEDVPDLLVEHFESVYDGKTNEPGRIWPPRVPKVVGFERSSYRVFSNVLLHVNGTQVKKLEDGAANLTFDENSPDLNFSVIDGQHRINGAYFAIKLLHDEDPTAKWEIPAIIFRDLDERSAAPQRQAQIFIDVNFYQKKVDRSLVADLFPTARKRTALTAKERAQDLGRKLMLEIGPLVGMVQIPGIKYGVADVITLATLNGAIEDVLEFLEESGIESLEEQAEFFALCLEAWLAATGRKDDLTPVGKLSKENVVYQGRVIASVITLIPACLWKLNNKEFALISDEAEETLTNWFKRVIKRAGWSDEGQFIDKSEFKTRGYLGSGGIARFRDTLWSALIGTEDVSSWDEDKLGDKANANRSKIYAALAKNEHSE